LTAPLPGDAAGQKNQGAGQIQFRDRKIDHPKKGLIQQLTGPGELSFDNIMQLRFSRTVRNLTVPLAFASSIVLLCVYYSGVVGWDSFAVLTSLYSEGASATASRLSSTTNSIKSTKDSSQIGSFARLTIEHCPENALWAPILVSLGINVVAHFGLWYQSARVSTSVADQGH
jgi:hypothetical protein